MSDLNVREQLMNKYWIEFMCYYTKYPMSRDNGHDGVEYPIIDQFWMWLAKDKVKKSGGLEAWKALL